MSAAELLRKASETVRRQPVLGTREMSLAIADWLDAEAKHADSAIRSPHSIVVWHSPHAEVVARLIVGEQA